MRLWLPPLAFGAGVLVAWQVLVVALAVPAFLLPAPTAIAGQVGAQFGVIVPTAAVTGGNALAGLVAGFLLGVALALTGVFLVAATRLTIPDARTHLIEYAVVGLLVYAALRERADRGRTVLHPGLLAFGITTVLGLLDEALQGILPGRVFDPVDVLFNTLAAAFAVGSSALLARLRRTRHGG